MKQNQKAVCPGCSRHCSMDNVRCKYGQKYFEKTCAQQAAASAGEKDKRGRRRKWEKHVEAGGTGWKLLWTAGCFKRALRSGKLTEAQMISGLNDEERAQLGLLLDRIARAAERAQ